MKNLRLLFPALLIAAVCGGGGYYFYQRQQARAQERDKAAEEWSNSSSRPDGPAHTLARTRFRILQSSAPDVFLAEGVKNPNWMQAQIKMLSSPKVLTPVVRRLSLTTEWGLSAELATARLQETVETELCEGTDVAVVTVRGYPPNTCADMANAVRDVYEQQRKEAEEERLRRLTQTVNAQLEAQEKTVEAMAAEAEAQKWREATTAAAPQTGASASPPQAEYATELRRYDSQVMLLNTLRELAAHQKSEGIVSRPIETLEVARPGLPRTP